MTLLVGLALVLGADAAGSWGMVPEPADVADQYREHANAKGVKGTKAELVCSAWFDDVVTCLTIVDETRWRYATRADLIQKGISEATARVEASKSLSKAAEGFETKQVRGVDGHYWARNKNDGREALLLLSPRTLHSVAGAPIVVAVPVQGAMVAWVPGHPERDEVLSIGVTRMNEESNHPVSDRVYRFDGEKWRVWGQAVKPKTAD